jgi:hypothetical protein
MSCPRRTSRLPGRLFLANHRDPNWLRAEDVLPREHCPRASGRNLRRAGICAVSRRLATAAMKSNDRRATAEFLIATIAAAIARGCKHYSERGELLATTPEVLECLQREGFVTVEEPDIACG